jgi:hypothetical protein
MQSLLEVHFCSVFSKMELSARFCPWTHVFTCDLHSRLLYKLCTIDFYSIYYVLFIGQSHKILVKSRAVPYDIIKYLLRVYRGCINIGLQYNTKQVVTIRYLTCSPCTMHVYHGGVSSTPYWRSLIPPCLVSSYKNRLRYTKCTYILCCMDT